MIILISELEIGEGYEREISRHYLRKYPSIFQVTLTFLGQSKYLGFHLKKFRSKELFLKLKILYKVKPEKFKFLVEVKAKLCSLFECFSVLCRDLTMTPHRVETCSLILAVG
jgi:hypothetical protein